MQVSEIKKQIIDGCKNAISSFKETGLSALYHAFDFMKLRQGLEVIGNHVDQGIQKTQKGIEKIETFSQEYPQAGMHFKNLHNVVAGQELLTEVDPVGKLAKTVEKPYEFFWLLSMSLKREWPPRWKSYRSLRGHINGCPKNKSTLRIQHLRKAKSLVWRSS